MSVHISSEIDSGAPFEVEEVTKRVVSCKSGDPSSSHPLVYLNMGKSSEVVCPYCSKKFVLKQ